MKFNIKNLIESKKKEIKSLQDLVTFREMFKFLTTHEMQKIQGFSIDSVYYCVQILHMYKRLTVHYKVTLYDVYNFTLLYTEHREWNILYTSVYDGDN